MKKIGILTFHYSTNYGATLQAYALQKTIKEMGYNDVEIINFVPESNKIKKYLNTIGFSRNTRKNILIFFSTIKSLPILKYRKSIKKRFLDFREKHLFLSKQINEESIFEIVGNYDIIIAGSDQIWNPSQRKMPFYFLDFGDKYRGKKASYAADSTIDKIEKEDLNKMRTVLNEFDFISVRNQHSFDFVKSATGKDAEIVVDPTILNDFNFNNQSKNQKEYILCYLLGKEINGSNKNAIHEIRKKMGNIPVYLIKSPFNNNVKSDFADKVFYDLSPIEWINMFQNASFVYTDSFHGVLFSIKYKKPFIAYYSEKLRATRFLDLGERYAVEKNIVVSVENIQKIDLKNCSISNETTKRIQTHKNDSLHLLLESLNKLLL